MIIMLSVALAEPYELGAEQMMLDEERICGWTELNIQRSDFQTIARYGCYHLDLDVLTLHQADLTYGNRVISFEDGYFKSNGAFWFNDLQITEPIYIKAAALQGNEESVVLNDISVKPCPCSDWSIDATQASLDEEWLWLENANLTLANRHFPIYKRRISTEGRGILLPQVSWEDGPWVRQAFRSSSGGDGWAEYRSILGPSVSYGQPVALDAMDFTSRLHLGFYEPTEALRGSFTFQQRDKKGWFQSGIQTQIMTDDEYLIDYGTTYMARQQPFLDQRLWSQASLFRAEVQQVSTIQEPLLAPQAILEDSILFGPVMGYGRVVTPIEEQGRPSGLLMLQSGHDGQYGYGSAELVGQASLGGYGIEPALRAGTYAYSDFDKTRLLSRYGFLLRNRALFVESQQQLLRFGRSVGYLTGRLPANGKWRDGEVELLVSGSVPVYAGVMGDRAWLTINHRVVQPSVFWWDGVLALVGRSNIMLPNETVFLQPSAVYFPWTHRWQSAGLGIILRQPKQCLEENLSIQWMPDRRLPVFRLQVSMVY